jgi:cystathionine beta-synthase
MRMKEFGVSQLPVVDDGRLVGIVTESDLLARIVESAASLDSSVAEVMFRKVSTLGLDDDASCLLQSFSKGEVGVIVDDQKAVHGILTKIDLVDCLSGTAGR